MITLMRLHDEALKYSKSFKEFDGFHITIIICQVCKVDLLLCVFFSQYSVYFYYLFTLYTCVS